MKQMAIISFFLALQSQLHTYFKKIFMVYTVLSIKNNKGLLYLCLRLTLKEY